MGISTWTFMMGFLSGMFVIIVGMALIERSRRRHQPPKGLSTSFDAGPSIYIGEPSNKDTPAVGEIWALREPDNNPFREPTRWCIMDVKNGFVQYASPDYTSLRWSLSLKVFIDLYKYE